MVLYVIVNVLCIGCSVFVSDSFFVNLWLVSVLVGIWLFVVRMLSVIGRLKWFDFFGRLVGVRLMVMWCIGNLNL